ncbi:bis(5'-nucleosyl)-tetraphosphatase (symmetrical) YqeK [Desmospora activa]|uniref:bis(5'-nucleosyl)-tetraphosphatase (symmetrical) n=1 Tax=Desmospora activa DSM 45169 TaxID=1121389 RepID=A0A2T4ZCE2_9BACL|nr:bis(5'-nucleosyl)-tetraphosphatase (symmetrical) YqeK [Desmospora activa]PTM59551.1 putative HD superfamily hydrolase involved in NAD metabolism [Desmospora activa DSM 45169]
MNRADWVEVTQAQMPRARWEHTLRVVETARELADRFGADMEKTEIAATLHDYCKFWPVEKMDQIIRAKGLPADLLAHSKELWHAFVGAEVVREELGVDDDEILNAIRYHTSGRPHMSQLEQVIFVADAIEPGRRYPGVDGIRKRAQTNLEEALLQSLDNTIRFLIERRQKVYPLTLAARNDLIDRIGSKQILKEESL